MNTNSGCVFCTHNYKHFQGWFKNLFIFIQDEDGEEPIPEDSSSDYKPDEAHHLHDMPEPAENYGKSQEKTEVMQEQTAQEDAGKSEEEKSKEVWGKSGVFIH